MPLQCGSWGTVPGKVDVDYTFILLSAVWTTVSCVDFCQLCGLLSAVFPTSNCVDYCQLCWLPSAVRTTATIWTTVSRVDFCHLCGLLSAVWTTISFVATTSFVYSDSFVEYCQLCGLLSALWTNVNCVDYYQLSQVHSSKLCMFAGWFRIKAWTNPQIHDHLTGRIILFWSERSACASGRSGH